MGKNTTVHSAARGRGANGSVVDARAEALRFSQEVCAAVRNRLLAWAGGESVTGDLVMSRDYADGFQFLLPLQNYRVKVARLRKAPDSLLALPVPWTANMTSVSLTPCGALRLVTPTEGQLLHFGDNKVTPSMCWLSSQMESVIFDVLRGRVLLRLESKAAVLMNLYPAEDEDD